MTDPNNVVVAAFSEEQVERLTGLTRAQLRYWDRTGFFTPAYVDDNRRLAFSRIYSFRDLVALRTLSVLRNQYSVTLQHLRKVAERLGHLGEDRWTGTTLYVLNRKVVFHEPDTDRPREVVSGQYVIGLSLAKIIDDTRRDIEHIRHRRPEQVGRVERSRHVAHNAWVIAGTRIATAAIRRYREAGYTTPQIIKEYPDLTADDVEAALTHERGLTAAA